MTSFAEPEETTLIAEPVNSAYDQLLVRIISNPQLPAMGMAVRQLSALSEDTTQRMNDLANIVLSDIFLTQRVLSLSNTVVYRTHPAPITTVSKALMLLGLNRVRVLALSATLLNQMEDPSQENNLRADFYQAIFASTLAAELARETGLADPEEAAIVAMFRHTGLLMLGLFDFPLLQKIRQLALQQAISEQLALRQQAGFSFSDLSRDVLTSWNIPAVLIDAATPTGTCSHSTLALLAQCADQLAEVLQTTSTAHENRAVEMVILQYAKTFEVGWPALSSLVANTRKACSELAGVLKLREQVRGTARSDSEQLGTCPKRLQADENLLSGSSNTVVTTMPVVTDPQAWVITQMVSGLQDMIDAIANEQSKIDICRIALETVHRAFGFERSLLFLADSGSGQLIARFVFGEVSAAQRLGFRFDPKNEADGIFAAVCRKNVDVHIRQLADSKLKPYLPPWFLKHFPDTQSMAFFPVVAGKQVMGLIYGDRNQARTTDFSAHELKMLKTLRNQLIVALRFAS